MQPLRVVAGARRLAQRDIGLEEVLRVLPASRSSGTVRRMWTGSVFGWLPVGHSVQYGLPSKSRSPFWNRLSWQPVARSGGVLVPGPSKPGWVSPAL